MPLYEYLIHLNDGSFVRIEGFAVKEKTTNFNGNKEILLLVTYISLWSLSEYLAIYKEKGKEKKLVPIFEDFNLTPKDKNSIYNSCI